MPTDAQRQKRALEILEESFAWPQSERDRKLAEATAGDPLLQIQIKRLMAVENAAQWLPTEPVPSSGPAQDLPLPETVGVYRLAECIGAGGMGAVYRGERTEGGFRQDVAIKLLRPGFLTNSAARQFARERQILAQLHHPHITQLYDGGTLPNGLSYIVMEYIQGDCLTTWVEDRKLGVSGRLELFRQVGDAIAYAHTQGVVHADIKPGNVLVADRLGAKIVDFGIAGLVDQEGHFGGRGVTPRYASPQLADGASPSPADDIFALGRLLDDLIPHAARDSEIAAVIEKATRTNPSHRYATVRDLVDDTERWRGAYPVLARVQSPLRTLLFFWRRHRWGVSFAALALTISVTAALVMAALYVRSEASRKEAENRFAEVRALSNYLLNDVPDALLAFPGTGPLRRELAIRGRGYLEALSHAPNATPAIRLDVARGYAKLGDILGLPAAQSLGDPVGAGQDLSKAEALLRERIAQTPDIDTELLLARTLTVKAMIAHASRNDTGAAIMAYNEACSLANRAIAAQPSDPHARASHVECLLGLANIHDYQGEFKAAMPVLDLALADLSKIGQGFDSIQAALMRANVLTVYGDAAYYDRSPASSLPYYQQAAATLEQASHLKPDARLLERAAYVDFNLADVLDELNRPADALPIIERGIAAADLLLAFDGSPRSRHMSNIVHMQRAVVLAALRRFSEAVQEAQADIAARRRNAALSAGDYEAQRAVPVALRPLGEIYRSAGDDVRACESFRTAREAWRALEMGHSLTGFDKSNEIKLVDKLVLSCAPAALHP
jgi:serine/threonine-protein kinase